MLRGCSSSTVQETMAVDVVHEVANDVVNSGRGRSGEESVNRARCHI